MACALLALGSESLAIQLENVPAETPISLHSQAWLRSCVNRLRTLLQKSVMDTFYIIVSTRSFQNVNIYLSFCRSVEINSMKLQNKREVVK